MLRVPIRSRNGNMVLAAIGVVYVISALVALRSVIEDAMNTVALLLTFTLGGGGAWFVFNALENLGVHFGRNRERSAH